MKNIRRKEQIAGIVLAAGEARRFGAPKQMLHWNGVPFIQHICNVLLESGLSHVHVVLGAYQDEIKQVLVEMPVTIVENLQWKKGLSTSVKTGVKSLPEGIEAVMMCLVDQPQIPVALFEQVIDRYLNTNTNIIAPWVNERRGNPVLFSREYFDALQNIKGDKGAKEILRKAQIEKVFWEDAGILKDVDTPEDWVELEITILD
ncbi:MAG: nucleotidyltransferase family protein [Anaerolineaceae bacterium]|nr:nucleotidyltransferase family protein [Anaerolineaceae bacterium]